jgi:hypothetical protein
MWGSPQLSVAALPEIESVRVKTRTYISALSAAEFWRQWLGLQGP